MLVYTEQPMSLLGSHSPYYDDMMVWYKLYFRRLADVQEGSAVATCRRLQEEKCHMPLSMW